MRLSEHTPQAEGEGFEPPVKTSPTMVFKTIALSHSAIPPKAPALSRAKILPCAPITVNENYSPLALYAILFPTQTPGCCTPRTGLWNP
jgi:hypothetical protein